MMKTMLPTGLIPSAIVCPDLAASVPSLPQTREIVELVEYDAWPTQLPILNQGMWNGCTYWSATQGLMYERALTGQPYVVLNPLWPYLQHTNGLNTGTNILQAMQRISTIGVPPVIAQAGTEATEARRFRWEIAARLMTWDEILSQVNQRRPVLGSVCAGPSYQGPLDSEGAMGVDAGIANHAVLFAGGLKKSARHGMMVRCPSSWGANVFDGGFGWYTRDHFNNTQYREQYVVQAVIDDPSDDLKPPLA